jgi:threonine/homoserine/homoserine lactone efflux protein
MTAQNDTMCALVSSWSKCGTVWSGGHCFHLTEVMRVATAVFLKGQAVGFSIAAPVGPIGALCIRRTIADGRAAGLASGMGAATADMLYGAVAAFGLTAVSGLLVGRQAWLSGAGGVFLLYLGVKTFVSLPSRHTSLPSASGLLRAYGTTFVLTPSNPVTILAFAAIFTGLGITLGSDSISAALLVAGVFLGSAAWWVVLSAGVGASRTWFSGVGMRSVNRVAGAAIATFGMMALLDKLR